MSVAPGAKAVEREFHHHKHFLEHCEIAALLVNRADRKHPSVEHHIREAVREASNHVAFGPGSAKHSAQYMSVDAQAQMEAGDTTGLIAEHVVPVSRLNELVFKEHEEHPATEESIAGILRAHTVRAVITSAEDQRLRALKLHKVMPEGSGDLMSRYSAARIDLVPNRYAELVKRKAIRCGA